ncbi:MAG TPA: MgtC/SapB family protein [Burkholderiaceae bacterium]|nr:MgtC/SapB family protein [Burkholderiaceae bacterium]
MDLELARNFLIALAIGALVGAEREKKKKNDPIQSFGGIRTHILIALVGAASAWLSREFGAPWIFVATLALVGATVLASYVFQNLRADDEGLGLTSEIAAIVVCLLGAMSITGNPELAAALGVGTSAVLAFKQPLHGLVHRIGPDDMFAGIKLLVASFIVLPLLPDAPVDPWGAINPYRVWMLVILISALSLVGYVAVRWLGTTHGTVITGIAGGLVSSTAATLSLARTSRVQPEPGHAHALSAAILLAWFVMVVRTLMLIAVVNAPLLATAWPPFLLLGAVTLAFAGWHYRGSVSGDARRGDADNGDGDGDGEGDGDGDGGDGYGDRNGAIRNPFSLASAIRFGALFAAVLLVVEIAQQRAPGVGVYVVSALAGSVDVDAITLSLAGNAGEPDRHPEAVRAILIAALTNTVVKCAMVVGLGGGRTRRNIVVAAAAIVLAGLVAVSFG